MPDHWQPPDHWRRITAIDAHTAGEPLRVITSGFPQLSGKTILEKRRQARRHHDHLRRALMWEPRGHSDMYGCILTEPEREDGDVGVLFLHNDGFSTMCGHGIIGLVKVGIECGLLNASGRRPVIRIDTPAGRVTARAQIEQGRVELVSFLNVASFLLEKDLEVEVPQLGRIRCDIAFGGAFYAYLEAESVGLEIRPANCSRIVDLGRRIKQAISSQYTIVHPDGNPDLNFLYGTIFVQGPTGAGPVHSRNVCVFADGEVDRSPTGTGVSGRAAIHHVQGELEGGRWITIESLIGTSFDVRVAETISLAGRPAIVPEVRGRAHITGRHEFLIDPQDPLGEGFLLR